MDDPSGGAVLEFDGLYKRYGANRVLEGVGFAVAPGTSNVAIGFPLP